LAGLARAMSVDEWRDRSVAGSFDACLRIARCDRTLTDAEARALCSVSSWNAFGVEPSRAMIRGVAGLPESKFYDTMRLLEGSGSVSCEGRGAFSRCRFSRCLSGAPEFASRRRGIEVSYKGRPSGRRYEVPAGSEGLFRHMTGVERQHLVNMVYERAPESWDVAAILDYIDPSLSYSENKEILDRLLPPALPTRAELESASERYREYLRGRED